MTHPDDTTALLERDLAAVDDALDTGFATHDDPVARELQELALALQADSFEPDPRFEQRLSGKVAAGFPRDPSSFRVRAPRIGKRLLPAAAALATVVVIGFGATQIDLNRSGLDDSGSGGGSIAMEDAGGGGGESAADSGGAVESVPPPDVAQDSAGKAAPDTATGSSQLARPRGGSFVPGQRQRRIERSIAMTLAAPDDQIARVAGGVTEITNRHGGFVLQSNLNSDDQGATGYFELRIPAERLREAIADLSALATVKSQSQSGQDVTREFVTAADRLDAARAERRSLLRRLGVAATDEEAEAIRRRLDLVAGEINGLRAQLRDLSLRTNYAVVTVDLAGEDGNTGSGGAGASFDDAVGDAGDLLVGVAGVMIRVLAVALPLGLVALVAWLAARLFRRRRRESVLA